MTLSFNLLLALFVLAPGLALHVGIFGPANRTGGRVSFAPPPPGSVLSLAIVVIGALAIHTAWALLSAVNSAVAQQCAVVSLPFNPNIYATILSQAEHHWGNPWNIAAVLAIPLLLSIAAYLATRAALATESVQTALEGLLYGWLSDVANLTRLVQKGRDQGFVTVFVLTGIEEKGVSLGYEGLLDNLTVDANKEVQSITLAYCTPFIVKMTASTVSRISVPRPDPIPRLHLQRDRIENVAFNVFRVTT